MEPYNKYNDCELFTLVSQQDVDAFTELYSRYWKKLYAIAYNRLNDRQLTEDAVQDVFTSLWTNKQLSAVTQPENYLAVSIKYVVLGKLKLMLKERAALMNGGVTPSVMEQNIESAIDSNQLLELIKTEVEKLPEKCRLVFKCSRNEGMPVKQIAHHLKISPKTVENHLTKALKQLKVVTRHYLQLLFLLNCI